MRRSDPLLGDLLYLFLPIIKGSQKTAAPAHLPARDYREYRIRKNKTDDHPAKNFHITCHTVRSFLLYHSLIYALTPKQGDRIRRTCALSCRCEQTV